ncbi:hypothetical protein GCM10009504_04380 [Pseudomonas laurentiana]|uniref:NfrA family protein n=1 Tax=Pseudomonas laurentiana TaxID=2364649 RepID=UPI001671C7E0|nr:phage receptor [Pseudomonas laurentiana]GGU50969.1 hypothetical protein GCM10009504_04380 [Pseudomonas laurentiana]
MKRRPMLIATGLLLAYVSTQALADPLSSFERFRSFPYMDRSYREARENNWQEVERLTRHLLETVPNNDEARALLIQALTHQRRYREAEQLAETLSARAEYDDALLQLRLTWIEQDPPGKSQVEHWIADSNPDQRIRLWQAYSLSLAKFGGAQRALDWLDQLPSKGDERLLRMARANWSEQLHNSEQTIAELAPLAARGPLPEEAWQRLANAYVQRLDETPLIALLAKPPSAEAARQIRLALINRAIAMGQKTLALRWLQSLPKQDREQPQQRQQLSELTRQSDRSALAQRLPAEAMPQHARRPGEAIDFWERLYLLNGSLEALDQATYLQLTNHQDNRAQQLLEHAYDRRQGRWPSALLQRLGGLYSRIDRPLDADRAKTLIPQLDSASREQLLARLSQTGHCDVVRDVTPPIPGEVGQLRALGRCAMPERPGEAVAYYQVAVQRGDQASQVPLAYALDAAGDAEAAYRIWQQLPPEQWTANARLTAARSALNSNHTQEALQHWRAAPHTSADDWALGAAIAQGRGDVAEAMNLQREALRHQPRADHYYAASVTAQHNNDPQQSRKWLAEAVRLAPDNPRYRADYGVRLAAADTPQLRRQSLPYLIHASHDFPEDYRIGETLAWRYDEVENSAAARQELRRIIDLEHYVVDDGADDTRLADRIYRQRRAHQSLSQRDSVTLASTWSPAGISTNDTLRSNSPQRRAASQNVQLALWDHALGDEPSRNGSTLSAYGRVLFGGQDRSSYAQSMGTGIGLSYKPLATANLNLYAELYHQRQIDDQHYSGLSLGQLLSPGNVADDYGDLRSNAQSSNDLLLRATASFFDQGDVRNDWRAVEDHWNERSLYLDAAWWTHAGDHQWTSRFQQGHTWKLPVASPQTLMPYGFLAFSSHDPGGDWRQDLRTGLGLRWQWWFDDDRYNAYRGHLTVRTEYQQALGGNLYEHANGVLLGVELNF